MAVIVAPIMSYCLKLSFWERRALVCHWKAFDVSEPGRSRGMDSTSPLVGLERAQFSAAHNAFHCLVIGSPRRRAQYLSVPLS